MSVLDENTANAPSEAAQAAMVAGRLTDAELTAALAEPELGTGISYSRLFTLLNTAVCEGKGGLVEKLLPWVPDSGKWLLVLSGAAEEGQEVYGKEVLRRLCSGEFQTEWAKAAQAFDLLPPKAALRLLGWLIEQAPKEVWIARLGTYAWQELLYGAGEAIGIPGAESLLSRLCAGVAGKLPGESLREIRVR